MSRTPSNNGQPIEPIPGIIGSSRAMMEVYRLTRQVARSRASVLLLGETGTGKELIARAIHEHSQRRNRPFVRVNCGALSESLRESELFGHVRGAFAGAWRDTPGLLEAAERGTALLDDVDELPPELQAKLLRFLAEGCFARVGGTDAIAVSTRIIAATSHDLEAEVRAGRFREDLFYRLNVIALRLPPLRERREDLPALTDELVTTLALRHQRHGVRLTPGARRAIDKYAWPGNVRELTNALERAVVLARDDTITVEDLPDQVLAPTAGRPALSSTPMPGSLEDVERAHVQRVLAESATLEEAAARLGIDATTLWRKRKRWGLE